MHGLSRSRGRVCRKDELSVAVWYIQLKCSAHRIELISHSSGSRRLELDVLNEDRLAIS